MRIELVEPTDEPALRAWFDVVAASQAQRWPGEPGWLYEEVLARALDPGPACTLQHIAVVSDGAVVASGRLELPVRDNMHVAELTIDVHPAQRRRGFGSKLVADLERRAAAEGRQLAVANVDEPAGTDSPGGPFLARHGYDCAQVNYRRDLSLPVEESSLAALEAACAPHAAGYRVVTWRDRCPDEYLADRAELGRRMSTDAPLGDLELEEEDWDAARLRDREATTARQGRAVLVAAAIHEASGQLVAFTEIGVPLAKPEQAYQWDTLVLREHRGHRLGTLVKIANHRALAVASPTTRKVTTWNAVTNAPMASVNEALGFAPVGTLSSWQKRLT